MESDFQDYHIIVFKCSVCNNNKKSQHIQKNTGRHESFTRKIKNKTIETISENPDIGVSTVQMNCLKYTQRAQRNHKELKESRKTMYKK